MNSVEPFGLPRGSVRAALVLLLSAGAVAAQFAGRGAAALAVVAAVVVRDYFAHRADENAAFGPPLPPPSVG